MAVTTPPTTAPPTGGIVPPQQQSGVNFFGGGTAGAPSTAQTGNPLISQDQSAYTQYVISQTGSYPVQIGNIPGVQATGATTIGQVLTDFMELPPAALMQIEMMLWDAGYYMNADGSAMDAQNVRFGVPGDPSSWTALARALSAAASSGQSLYALLSSRAQQGAGAVTQYPQAVLGGGNTYNIDLTAPGAVNEVANQVFQSALGRNATAAEMAKITSSVNAQTIAQGLAQEQGQETSSQQRYTAQINQRNIQFENATNPNQGGTIPSGPFNDINQWAVALLAYMGMPVTASNVSAIAAWGGPNFNNGNFNPLGTSRPEGGSTTGPNGQAQFQNWAQGLEATASMLMDGRYQALISALQAGNAGAAVKSDPNVKQDLQVWSGGTINGLNVTQQQAHSAAKDAQAFKQFTQGQAQQQGQGGAAAFQNIPGYAAFLKSGGTPQEWQAGVSAAEAGSGASLAPQPNANGAPAAQAPPAGATSVGVNPQDVNLGQQPPNPGDQYINPVTTYTQNPLTAEQTAYDLATTGANRFSYGENNALNAFMAVVNLIQSGGIK